MAEFSYDIEATIDPPSARPGATLTVTVKLSNVVGEAKSVNFVVKEYGMWDVLQSAGENVYKLERDVPYNAPAGTYNLTFFAKDTEGNKGKEVVVPFTVTY